MPALAVILISLQEKLDLRDQALFNFLKADLGFVSTLFRGAGVASNPDRVLKCIAKRLQAIRGLLPHLKNQQNRSLIARSTSILELDLVAAQGLRLAATQEH